jgi:heme exporter protein D
MGGYGGYVWPAYGITAVVLVGVLVASRQALRRSEAELSRLQEGRRDRRARPSPEEGA